VRTIPISHGKACTPVAVGVLVFPARGAIRATPSTRRGSRMGISRNGWKRAFDDPIPLPRGAPLVTLQDAGKYITKLPKAEHEAAEWQAAMEALILVVTLGGPTMFARIGVMRALNRHVERVFNPTGNTRIRESKKSSVSNIGPCENCQ
jgi:hypothetical protein